jgi:hypothetical protein
MSSGGMMYISSSMKIGTGVQALLRVFLSNLKDCNVDITDDRDLRNAPLNWGQMT